MDAGKFVLFDNFSATQKVAYFLLIPQPNLLMTVGPELSTESKP
jgi:hypothetical protein